MGWILLIAGVGLWWAAHLYKRMAPAQRAELGDKGKGYVAIALVISILLMIFGYRWTGFVQVWSPPGFFVHINNLLILVAIFMMSPAPKKGRVLSTMRHPMLTGFGLWAFAHLLVNGDLASIFLFAGLLAWVPVQIQFINSAEPEWTAPEPGSYAKDGMFLVGSIILLVIIGVIHGWLGPWPFG
ncbi:MAG: NnrU family protein [Pseudomonadota bacterium]